MTDGGPVCPCGGTVDALGWCRVCGAEITRAPFDQPADPQVLQPGGQCGNGRFTLIEPLGRGGMGEVWLAIDEKLSAEGAPTEVALKFPGRSVEADPEWVALLRREVLAARRLSHAGIVRVHDWHEHPGEPVFYSMEYVPGGTLRDRLSAHPEGRMTSAELSPFLEQIVSALDYSHQVVGMVHRDIKPANILVRGDGHVKLADFGLARPNLGADASVTTEGGTPAYASPQQRRGDPPSPADDIYSLGALLYHLTTGRFPFTPEEWAAPGPLPIPLHPWRCLPNKRRRREAVSPAAAETILRCLREDPALRPPDVVALWNWWRSGPPTEPGTPEQATSSPRRPWVPWLAALVVVAVMAGIGLGIAWWKIGPKDKEDPHRGTDTKETTGKESGMSHGPSNVEPAGTVLKLHPSPGFPLSAEVVIHPKGNVGESGGGKAHPLWQGTVTSTGPMSVRLPKDRSGVVIVEAGSGPKSWAHWTRTECRITAGSTNQVELNLERNNLLDVYLSAPAPLVVIDEWGNQVFAVTSEDYHSYGKSPNPQAPFRWLPARVPLMGRLTAGLYRLSLTWEATNLLYLGPWERTVRIPQTDSLSEVLPDWQWPRTRVSWTNTLGMVLLPVPAEVGVLGARTETTLGQFRQYADSEGIGDWPIDSIGSDGSGSHGHTWRNPGRDALDSHPVVGVSWEDASRFCKWLTRVELGKGRLTPSQRYELPTTEQWNRMAGTNVYPWGDHFPPLERQGNYAGRSVKSSDWPSVWSNTLDYDDGDSIGRSPVGSHEPNFAGFVDLGGNAAEWCRDRFDPELNRSENRGNVPRLQPGGVSEGWYVVRGASWASSASNYLRTDMHWTERGTYRGDCVGFRVVLVDESERGRADAEIR